MQSTAISTSDTPKPSRKRISKRMQKALTLLATKGITQREAAKQAGMSETYLSVALRKPEIGAFIARKSRENIQLGVLRASSRFMELVDAESEHVAAKVSDRILTSEGILKSESGQVAVSVGVSVGYVIDLSGQSSAPTITVSHEGDA
jgi:hypothetical protein